MRSKTTHSLIGESFGDLLVIKQLKTNHRQNRVWLCRCSCGNERHFPTSYLTTKRNSHCGCRGAALTRVVACYDCSNDFIPKRVKKCDDGILRCKQCSKINTQLWMDYGISFTEYKEILSQQHGVCKICKCPPKGYNGSRLYVDHDHNLTGRKSVRGLLCRNCNLLLGFLRDNKDIAREAISYLEEYEHRYLGQ